MSSPNQALPKRTSFSLLCVLLSQLAPWALTLGWFKHTVLYPITNHHTHMPPSHNEAFQVVRSSMGRLQLQHIWSIPFMIKSLAFRNSPPLFCGFMGRGFPREG
jgi:hypothetical protein